MLQFTGETSFPCAPGHTDHTMSTTNEMEGSLPDEIINQTHPASGNQFPNDHLEKEASLDVENMIGANVTEESMQCSWIAPAHNDHNEINKACRQVFQRRAGFSIDI